jgi:C4-dicarboxylate-binding protein DctP
LDTQLDSGRIRAVAVDGAAVVLHPALRALPAASKLLLMLSLMLWMPGPGALAQTTTLRLALPVAADSPTGQNIREFARQVQAQTNGAVKIEILGSDQAYDERGVVSAVTSGAVEIGATPLSQLVPDVPLAGAFLQPFLFNFDALAQAATTAESEVRMLIDAAILERTSARVLWWQPYGSSVILSKGISFANPAAAATRVVAAPDKQMRDLLRICGAAPMPASPTSLFAGMKDGTIQAGAADIMNVGEHEFWRVADAITDLRQAPSLFAVLINEKAWQALSREQQETFAELAQDAQGYMWARFATVRGKAYVAASQKGMRVIDLQAEDVAAWRACSAPLLEDYMERAGEAGPKLFAAYGKLRTDPCCRDVPGDAPAPR